MFLGRKRELSELKTALDSAKRRSILIYGRRRVGKTTLIEKAIENTTKTVIFFTAIPDELSENARRLSALVGKAFKIPGLLIPDFEALLNYISSIKDELIIVIDEYQDLRKRAKGDVVDAYLRDFIDKAGENIHLVVSGSAIRTMKSLLQKDNPLYGRFPFVMPIGELDYLEASLFYPERSIKDKISLYAIFGGVPMILSQIDAACSVEENLSRLLLARNGSARSYVEDVLIGEIRDTGGAYSVILRIGNGRRTFSEIRSCLDDEKNRNSLDYTLEQLLDAAFITKKQPINHIGERRKTFYELDINLLRFYLAYIERNPGAVTESKAFYNAVIKPSLGTFVSYRFEEMVRTWFLLMAKRGIRDDIIAVGTYWYDDPKSKTNGEFDVALQTLSGYEIYEVKHLSSPMPEDLIEKERNDFRNIRELENAKLGFISSSGFEVKEGKEARISGEELFKLEDVSSMQFDAEG